MSHPVSPVRGYASLLAALLLASSGLVAQSAAPRPLPEKATAGMTAERSKQHIDMLASDRMMGRNTPSTELDSAAAYIAASFQAFGLEPVAGSYYNDYRLKREDLGSPTTLKVKGQAFELKSGFIPYEFSPSGKVSGEVVFAGYGISLPDSGYDDYAGLDVRGKIVLVVAGEPARKESRNGVPAGLDPGPRDKMRTAARNGAVGFMMLPNPTRTRTVRPSGYPWRTLYPSLGSGAMPIKLDLPSTEPSIPAVGVGGEVAQLLFGTSMEKIADLVRTIDSTGRPASKTLKGNAELEVTIDKTTVPARNVVGMIRGSVNPDEYVVIGAHYDHVGYFAAPADAGDSTREGIDTIYNGADDNASGTTALLLVAEALGALPPAERPARSILLIAFSGEEKGLFGSRAYVAAPLVPVASTVAMLNMDMVGRNSPDSVSLAGRSRSPELSAMAEQANQAEPITIVYDLEPMFFRSDQASFAQKQIPVLFFSSGMHPDYHQVSDSPDKIENGKLSHIARLCLRTAWLVAESPVRPRYDTSGDVGESMFD